LWAVGYDRAVGGFQGELVGVVDCAQKGQFKVLPHVHARPDMPKAVFDVVLTRFMACLALLLVVVLWGFRIIFPLGKLLR